MCPVCVSSCTVRVCRDWEIHLEGWKSELDTTILSKHLTDRSPPMISHPVPPDIGSGVEVCAESGHVQCCVTGPRLEVCWEGLFVGSYCVSAFDDSRVCWVWILWRVGRLQGRPTPRSHPGWNPRAPDHLQRNTNQNYKKGTRGGLCVEPSGGGSQHLLNTRPCCRASCVPLRHHHWQLLHHHDLEEREIAMKMVETHLYS